MKQMFKTTVLLAALTGLFLAIGYMVGGQSGMILALLFAAVFNFGTYWFSGSLVLKMQGAKPLDVQHPAYRTVEPMVRELAAADNLPMPKLYYVDTPLPNAFATGRSPKHAVVAVTTGILDLLNDNELKAVIGHELGHVKNRDMLVSTVAATVAGAISSIAQMLMFSSLFGGDDEDQPNPLASIAIMLLAPIAAALIQMAVSRSREFLADQHGAHLVGNGKDLASALQKLENFKASVPPIQASPTDQTAAHLMFTNMFSMQGVAGLFSTHPTTKQRVERLKAFDGRTAERGAVGGPILERN